VIPGGLATLDLRFRGPPEGRATLVRWARETRAALAPARPVPGLDATILGRVLAWTEGDLDVEDGPDEARLTAAMPAPRATRLVAGVMRDALARCGR